MLRSNDNQYLRKVLRINEYIQEHSLKEIRRKYDDNIMSSIFTSHKTFANALFKEVELQFIPLYITTYIGETIFDITPRKFGHYITFIKNNQAIFKAIHEGLRKKQFEKQPNDQKYYEEQMKRILLAEAYVQRNRPLNLKTLMKTIYDRVYMFPIIPEISDLYQFYLRNLPSKTVRTFGTPMPKITLTNQQKEEVKRLPWKSKIKVNYYMNKNKWTEEQKEYAREYLLNDGFSLKKNLKYQLKAVAPRHTLIIDLIYLGKFVYLLAINVNTRKAYAIPSPLIIFQSVNRYIVPDKGHKETNNVIKMFKQLLEQTPVKMVICDQEPAFISKEFKQLCLKRGITLHHYVMNRIGALSSKDISKSSRAVHGLLSILDRLVRTLRNMAYNMGITNQDINPDIIKQLVNVYNRSPHTTFYKIFKRPITPNEMDKDKLLEDKLCYILTKQNFVIRNSKGYNITTDVRVMNQAHEFDKLKHKLLPGIFTIVGKDNNLFICKQGNNLIKVPRYMLKPV